MYTEKDISVFESQIDEKQKELEILAMEIFKLKEQYKEIARQKHVLEVGKRQLERRIENNKNAESIVFQTFGKHTDELTTEEKHQYDSIVNKRRRERNRERKQTENI